MKAFVKQSHYLEFDGEADDCPVKVSVFDLDTDAGSPLDHLIARWEVGAPAAVVVGLNIEQEALAFGWIEVLDPFGPDEFLEAMDELVTEDVLSQFVSPPGPKVLGRSGGFNLEVAIYIAEFQERMRLLGGSEQA